MVSGLVKSNRRLEPQIGRIDRRIDFVFISSLLVQLTLSFHAKKGRSEKEEEEEGKDDE